MSDWDGTGAAYAASFADLTRGSASAVLDAVAARVSSGTLLDVGAGSGVVVAAARGRGYRVIAAEPEASMIDVLTNVVPAADILVAGLPSLPLDDGAVDVVTANFVLNHVDDPRASAAELARVTRPHGVVAVTIWPDGASPLRPIWQAMSDAAGAPRPVATLAPDLDFARTEEGLRALLSGAGLSAVETSRPAWVWEVRPDVLWRAVEGGVATIGNLYRRASPEARAHMRAAYERETAARVTRSGTLRLPHEAILAVGVRRGRA